MHGTNVLTFNKGDQFVQRAKNYILCLLAFPIFIIQASEARCQELKSHGISKAVSHLLGFLDEVKSSRVVCLDTLVFGSPIDEFRNIQMAGASDDVYLRFPAVQYGDIIALTYPLVALPMDIFIDTGTDKKADDAGDDGAKWKWHNFVFRLVRAHDANVPSPPDARSGGQLVFPSPASSRSSNFGRNLHEQNIHNRTCRHSGFVCRG